MQLNFTFTVKVKDAVQGIAFTKYIFDRIAYVDGEVTNFGIQMCDDLPLSPLEIEEISKVNAVTEDKF